MAVAANMIDVFRLEWMLKIFAPTQPPEPARVTPIGRYLAAAARKRAHPPRLGRRRASRGLRCPVLTASSPLALDAAPTSRRGPLPGARLSVRVGQRATSHVVSPRN